MFRLTLAKSTYRSVAAPSAQRAFTTTLRAMSEGDTGAPPKTGGQGDAFQRRERANEDYEIKKREREKLLELRKKIKEQQKHLQTLSEHIEELTKEQGGEQN